MHPTDIIGYTFKAANYCGDCIVEALHGVFDLSPAARDMNAEDVLHQVAATVEIDRDDEHTFDSDEFPKVVFASSVECCEHCDDCGACLVCGEHEFRGIAISSNHYSVDDQAVDAMAHLRFEHRDEYDAIVKEFPDYTERVMSGAAFDTDAMGVDVEWGSWLVDAIENTGVISWDDGEPYCTAKSCRVAAGVS